jgi:hypothetical protein
MASLWIANIAPGTSDDELKEFLARYGFPAFTAIEHVPGDGSRPAALVKFEGVDAEVLRPLQPRVDRMFWKGRTLSVQLA